MADSEKKAREYIAQAEKKMKGGFVSNLFGSSGKAEEAIGLYVNAANAFKMAKNWKEAGDAFATAAKLALESKSKHDAAGHYADASNCYKKVSPQESVNCLLKGIELHTDGGRFTMAAKNHIAIAEIFEADLADLEKAIQHYEQAADYYKGEESASQADKCLTKVAQFSAQIGQYEKASNIYAELGKAALGNNLRKYAAKDFFFKSAVCQMAIDPINGQNALESFSSLCPSFADSRESKLLKTLLAAIDENNVENFTAAVREYDSISRLDPMLTALFLKIKKNLNDEDELC